MAQQPGQSFCMALAWLLQAGPRDPVGVEGHLLHNALWGKAMDWHLSVQKVAVCCLAEWLKGRKRMVLQGEKEQWEETEGWKRKSDMDITFINLLHMMPTFYQFVASLEPFIAWLLLLLLLLLPSKNFWVQKKYSVQLHLSSSSKPKRGV